MIKLGGAILFIGLGLYSLYDTYDGNPQSNGGKTWTSIDLGVGFLALLFGAFMLISAL